MVWAKLCLASCVVDEITGEIVAECLFQNEVFSEGGGGKKIRGKKDMLCFVGVVVFDRKPRSVSELSERMK